jgi:hypothetical protein
MLAPGGSPGTSAATYQGAIGRAQDDAAKAATKSALSHAAGAAATTGKSIMLDVNTYVVENPMSIQVISFILGVTLTTFSILGIFNFLSGTEAFLMSIYNSFFGLVIVVADGPTSCWDKLPCGNLQAALYKYFYVLANPFGRALFYWYVGSIVIFLGPEDGAWYYIYICLGAALMAVGAVMIIVRCCKDRCTKNKDGSASGAGIPDPKPIVI